MKNKYKHGKAIAATTMALAAVSLVTVGFSAWVISYSNTQSLEGISVSVAEVKDQTVTIANPKLASGNDTISLDAPVKEDTTGYITSSDGTEDMTFAIEFDINLTGGKQFKGIRVSATEAATVLKDFEAEPKNYIELPFKIDTASNQSSEITNYINVVDATWTEAGTHYITYSNAFANASVADTDPADANWDVKVVVSGSSSGTLHYVCEFQFQWGKAFGNEHANPVFHDTTEEEATASKTALEALKAADPISFDLKLNHDPKTTVKVAN